MENPYSQLQYDVEVLKTCVANLLRPATVTYVYRKSGDEGIQSDRDDGSWIGFVDVVSGELELERIPIYTAHNNKDQDSVLWLPTEGEDGNIFSSNGDLAQAFFVSAIPTKNDPIPNPNGPATETIVSKMRGGNKEELILKDASGSEVNQYKHEIGVRSKSFTKIIHGDSIITMDKDEVLIEHNNSKVTLDGSKVFVEHSGSEVTLDSSKVLIKKGTFQIIVDGSKTRQETSATNYKELTAIVANIIGAHFYPAGLTTLVNAAGNCFFAPTPSPASAPSLPAGVESNSDGVVTKTPDEEIDDVVVRSGSDLSQTWSLENMSLIIQTPIPVVTPAGPGSIVAGTYPIRLTGTPNIPVTGKLNITFPGRDL